MQRYGVCDEIWDRIRRSSARGYSYTEKTVCSWTSVARACSATLVLW